MLHSPDAGMSRSASELLRNNPKDQHSHEQRIHFTFQVIYCSSQKTQQCAQIPQIKEAEGKRFTLLFCTGTEIQNNNCLPAALAAGKGNPFKDAVRSRQNGNISIWL